MKPQLLLASRSPRRAQLLRQAGFAFRVHPTDLPEQPAPGQAPGDYALALAVAKARAAPAGGLPVLGADTDVAVDGEILGKPRDCAHALAMLARLSGRTHQVFSAVAVVAGDGFDSVLSVTEVTFGGIRPEEARAYWDSGEAADKAGAYAIQGRAARWVRTLRGSYSGVVGLPLYETCQLLGRFGVTPR
ncbi:MAG: septum formation inhibitor Maf [Gammaproteobacteria bacterium]|nr:septum formation inhibitor Maf [Gammaproteobacteria bacterium]